MQAVVLGFQLLECRQAVVGNIAGAGVGVLVNFQHRSLLAVQAGVAVGCVVDDLYIRNIRQAHVAVAVHMQQQGTGDILHAVVLFADLQQPRLAVLVLHITCRHGEVLGIDQLCKGVDIQLFCHIGLRQCAGFCRLVFLLGAFQLLFVFVQHLTRFGELHIGVELLLGEIAQRVGELAHQLGHIVHGLDGVFQGIVDGIHAVLQLYFVHKVLCRAAFGAGLGVDTLLQFLKGRGQLIRDIAQLGHDIDQGIDIPHAGLVELVQNLLQAVAHLDQRLLDLRLLDHGDQAVDAVQQRLRLIFDCLHRSAHLGAHGAHDRVGHRVAEVLHLLFVFPASGSDLRFGAVQLGTGCRQLGIDEFQQLRVDIIDLGLVQLHLHQLFHKAVGRNTGYTALALNIGHHGVLDKIRQIVDIAAFPADSHGHESVHVQAVLNDGRGQAAARQIALGLIQLVGYLDQSAVHIRVIRELHQQQTVVFR